MFFVRAGSIIKVLNWFISKEDEHKPTRCTTTGTLYYAANLLNPTAKAIIFYLFKHVGSVAEWKVLPNQSSSNRVTLNVPAVNGPSWNSFGYHNLTKTTECNDVPPPAILKA